MHKRLPFFILYLQKIYQKICQILGAYFHYYFSVQQDESFWGIERKQKSNE